MSATEEWDVCSLVADDTVPDYSGMLAYVMDGNIATAKQSVEAQIGRKSEELRLHGEAKIHSSKLMPKGGSHGETHHKTDGQKSAIFHMFLLVTRSGTRERVGS